ncbi:MAG: hypothetical protein ACP5QG_04275 [candidate division WOR-3 bacterium]
MCGQVKELLEFNLGKSGANIIAGLFFAYILFTFGASIYLFFFRR